MRLAAESRSTQATAQPLGSSPKLLYRWHEAKLVAEVGNAEVAGDPEVRQLRTQLKRAEQEPDILKKPGSSSAAEPVGAYRCIAQRQAQAPLRQLCQTLRVSASAYYAR